MPANDVVAEAQVRAQAMNILKELLNKAANLVQYIPDGPAPVPAY